MRPTGRMPVPVRLLPVEEGAGAGSRAPASPLGAGVIAAAPVAAAVAAAAAGVVVAAVWEVAVMVLVWGWRGV